MTEMEKAHSLIGDMLKAQHEQEKTNLELSRKVEAQDRRIRRLVQWREAALAHAADLASDNEMDRAAAAGWWLNQFNPERIVQS